jgi:hypothetical protein
VPVTAKAASVALAPRAPANPAIFAGQRQSALVSLYD